MNEENIWQIGVWSLRGILAIGAIGAIVAGIMGHTDVTSGCGSALVVTFFLL